MNEPQQQFMSMFTETLLKIMSPAKTLVVGVPLQNRPDPCDFPAIFKPRDSFEVAAWNIVSQFIKFRIEFAK